jgi:hypothetical protein
MHDVETIFKTLSMENKSLKPGYAYKTGQEGLLRAFYFFRWCNKNGIDTADKVIEQFVKKKVPEQQTEHFGAALMMIDQYESDPSVKEYLIYIEENVKVRSGGKGVLEIIEPQKAERRVLKNVVTTFREAVESLKKRSQGIRGSSKAVWIIIGILLVVNLTLAFTNVYQHILDQAIPKLLKGSLFLRRFGGEVLAGILILFPSLAILFVNRHKLSEHSRKGGEYPQEIRKMEKALAEFEETLKKRGTIF